MNIKRIRTSGLPYLPKHGRRHSWYNAIRRSSIPWLIATNNNKSLAHRHRRVMIVSNILPCLLIRNEVKGFCLHLRRSWSFRSERGSARSAWLPRGPYPGRVAGRRHGGSWHFSGGEPCWGHVPHCCPDIPCQSTAIEAASVSCNKLVLLSIICSRNYDASLKISANKAMTKIEWGCVGIHESEVAVAATVGRHYQYSEIWRFLPTDSILSPSLAYRI